MNNKTNLHIALAAASLLIFGTGCASIVREPPEPNPVPDIKVPPKLDAQPVATADEPPKPQGQGETPLQAAEEHASSAFVPDGQSERSEAGTPEESAPSAKDESSAPSPKPAVTVAKPALKRGPQQDNVGLLSKTPVAQPPPANPDGSLTRLDEMKKQGTMSEEAYGQIRRQILENPE